MNKLRKLWKDRQNQYRYAGWLLGYAKPYLGRIGLLFFLNIAATAVTLAMAQVSKEVIDRGAEGKSVVFLLLLYAAMILGVQAFSAAASLLAAVVNEKFSFGIRRQIYEKIIRSHWLDVKKYHTGDLMTRLTSDAGSIADGIVNTIPGILRLSAELIMVFCMLFWYSPLLAVLALTIAPVAGIASLWLGRRLKKLQVKVQESESAYRSFLQESLANLLIVKAFANEDYFTQRLVKLRDERFRWVWKRTKFGLAGSAVMSVSFQAGYIAAFTYGALQISRKAITYGTMSVFLTLVNRMQEPVIGLANQIPRIVSVLASAGRVMELQSIPLEETQKKQIRAERVGVRVEGLTFGYTEETVLEDVSLQIRPGEFAAIVGESGIGKTTLIRLVLSFMSNAEGEVTFYNEAGERERAGAGTRNFIAYVPQGNTLFSGTVRENIRMGRLDASEEEILEALRLASGYDFVMGLPEGLDTVIGERGHGLSEGQAQRIAIARAFVRKAPFLILDEATSSLDELTELQVIRGLQQLTPRPACLIVTHRRSILAYCDREIKIENKHVHEAPGEGA